MIFDLWSLPGRSPQRARSSADIFQPRSRRQGDGRWWVHFGIELVCNDHPSTAFFKWNVFCMLLVKYDFVQKRAHSLASSRERKGRVQNDAWWNHEVRNGKDRNTDRRLLTLTLLFVWLSKRECRTKFRALIVIIISLAPLTSKALRQGKRMLNVNTNAFFFLSLLRHNWNRHSKHTS